MLGEVDMVTFERDDDDFLLANRKNWLYGDQSAENCSNSSRLWQLFLEEDEDVDH